MRYPEIPVFSSIVAVLLLVPLSSRLRARNIPTLTLILSMFLVNVKSAVDTLVWNGNTRDVAPGWCEFGTNVKICWAYFALGACLCISKDLEWITSSRSAVSSRRHKLLFEVIFCFFIPLISIPFRYIVARSRYAIVEDFGCQVPKYRSAVDIALTWVPDIALSIVCFIFACMAARNLILRKITSQTHTSTSVLIPSRFIRLLVLCVLVGVGPLLIIHLSFFLPPPPHRISTWHGWAAVHRHFYVILIVPLRFLPIDVKRSILRSFWYDIISGFLIFFTFVFTEDVRKDLHRFWDAVTCAIPPLRLRKASLPPREAPGHGSPIHMTTTLVVECVGKTQSGESFSMSELMPDAADKV